MQARLHNNEYSPVVKGILFDKDGTLLRFIPLWGSWCELLIEQVKEAVISKVPSISLPDTLPGLLGVSYDDNGKIIDYHTEGLLSKGTMGQIREVIVQYVLDAGLTAEKAAEIAEKSMRQTDKEVMRIRPVQIRDGLIEFLEQCRARQIQLAVVTSDETSSALNHLEWADIRHYFTVVFGNDSVQKSKPDPEMVYLACERLGLSPKDVAVIGDTESDMSMGKSAGVALTVAVLPERIASGDERAVMENFKSADLLISSYNNLKLSTAKLEREGNILCLK